MEVFEKAFNWLANLSSKLPTINVKMYFIIVLAVIAVVGVIVALTLLGSRAFKLKKASKKIIKYLAGVECINDENVSDFTTQCFSAKVPQALRETWVQYLGVRYGYPSDIINDQSVFDKTVKKQKDVRANAFIAIALILVALSAFWGFGTLETVEMSVIHCAGLLLSAIIYILIVIFTHVQSKKCLEKFDEMLEDLDAKLNLQVENDFAVDSSPLVELSAMVDEIVARNTSKAIDIDEEVEAEIEETPIEALIAQEEQEVVEEEQAEEEEEVVEEVAEEETEEQAEEVADEPAQVVEEEIVEEVEEPAQEELIEEEPAVEEEPVEEPIEEPVEVVEEEIVEEEPTETEEVAEEEPVVEEEPAVDELDEELDEVDDELEQLDEELNEDDQEQAEEPVEDESDEEEEEVVYVEDDMEDDAEEVKPSKFAKLPNLVDYMLAQKMPKVMKMQVTGMLLGVYQKTEKGSEERRIIGNSAKKVMSSLVQDYLKAQQN